ncbi:hypothetical protein M885DRAFT_615301 [Pelagophyceae sp. CCMP2097]|nr:hypothetical protein M885DRAFT_615301 [Pelagophyceae sp. CCMP2097]|mmetsp:Transcript_10602/g.36705  ORF Transcript_10602/g.36705 Transcript_10602/m.36705 type:complete len:94 (+) Transcript_10602:103-384(+)
MAPGAIFADAVPDAECVTVSEAEPLLIKEAKPLYSRGLWLLILSVVVLWLTAGIYFGTTRGALPDGSDPAEQRGHSTVDRTTRSAGPGRGPAP